MSLLEVGNGIHGQSGFKAVWFCDKQVSIIRNVWCHGGSWLLFPVSNVILSSHVLLGHPPSSSPSFIRICCFFSHNSFCFCFSHCDDIVYQKSQSPWLSCLWTRCSSSLWHTASPAHVCSASLRWTRIGSPDNNISNLSLFAFLSDPSPIIGYACQWLPPSLTHSCLVNLMMSQQLLNVFIGPESDHWQCLSLTDSLTDSLTP